MIAQRISLLLPLTSCRCLSRPCKFSTFANPKWADEKSCCIFLSRNCNSTADLRRVHARIFRVGLHRDKDTLRRLLVSCTDPYNGNLNYAEKIFNYVPDPCLIIYNLMIKAFAKKGRFRKCLVLFGKLREDRLWPDNFTYPFVLKAIGCLGEFLEAEKLHGLVVKTGLEFDAYVCNSLMDMYGQLGRIDLVKKLFDEMPERDVVSWNVLISGYVKHGRFVDAIGVYCHMKNESGLRPDEATVVSTLSACAAVKKLELGEEIHQYVRERLGFTPIIGHALLDMYCKCGCLKIARELFDKMPSKNVICWTSMVSGYVNCGKVDEARELFERSPGRDVVLWTAMINGYVQFNHFDEAVTLFREMQVSRVKPDKFLVVALLTGCAQMGALEQGKWIHGYIGENRIPVDTFVGTALVEMYAKCGCIEKALEIFYGLWEKDSASWTSIICGLAMNGKTGKALKLFSEMREAGAKPDDITFIGVLSACNHGGLVAEGREFFTSMTTLYKIEPKLEHYGCIIDLLGRAGRLDEAEELIKNIPDEDNEAIVPIYGSLLSSCRTYGNVEMGKRLAERLLKIKSRHSSTHTLLASIYAFADKWDDVTKVRRKMKDLGVTKVPGCSSIEVDGTVHEFVVRDPSHPKIMEIFSILDSLTKPLMTLEETEIQDEDVISTFFW